MARCWRPGVGDGVSALWLSTPSTATTRHHSPYDTSRRTFFPSSWSPWRSPRLRAFAGYTPVLNSLRRYESCGYRTQKYSGLVLFQSEQVDGGGENKIEAYRVFDLSIQLCTTLLDDLLRRGRYRMLSADSWYMHGGVKRIDLLYIRSRTSLAT
jgi:hypothetical protein